MSATGNRVFHFDGFDLEPDERRLSRRGRIIPLTPKVFELLVRLVEHAGHVLSKDDLMDALWPGRPVTESNLTKHVWLLRKALEEDGDGTRLIETVSKVGYRFRAPVTQLSEPRASEARSSPAGPAPRVSWSRKRTLAVLSAGMLATAGLLSLALVLHAPAPWTSPGDTAVSLLALDNLSRNPKDAWVGPALTETLGTEIGLGRRVHVTPAALAAPIEATLSVPGAGGFGLPRLWDLRRRLGADYVLSGGYLVTGDGGEGEVRLDLVLQDTRGGRVVNLSRSGQVAELPSLVTLLGADLRARLGAGADRADGVKMAAGLQAPSVEVMRHMGAGAEALRRFDPAHARDEFLEAVAQAPAYAPAYGYLAQAWSALGYKAKARAAAEQAAALSADLPPPVRLQIVAQRQISAYDWAGAGQTLRQLIALRPGDPENRLQLVDVLVSAGKANDAAAALNDLRALPAAGPTDPRIELAAAGIAASRDDNKAGADHAARALALARSAHEPGLAGEAGVQLANALGGERQAQAAQVLRQALADYTAAGDPHGQAWAHQNLGNLWVESDPAKARREYEQAMAIYQTIGDQGGVAASYSNLGIMMWSAGDRDGAETAVRHVLAIREETQDPTGQAWALAALAIEQSDEAITDEVIANFRRAITLDESAGAQAHLGFTLLSLSDDLRLRGDLAGAAKTCADAQRQYGALGDPAGRAGADFECAQIALDRGDLSAASAGLKTARTEARAHGDQMTLANADLLAGEIAMGQRRWAPASASFDSAARQFAASDLATGEAVASSLLALSEAALEKTQARDAAEARARTLRRKITERQEVIPADIALAQLAGETGSSDAAVDSLRALAAGARKSGWESWGLEADLAAVQVLDHSGDKARAAALRGEVAADARRLGFNWVLRRLS
jgi:DNA-binding winged helix-turn-helix (wHTH) protein